MQQTRWSEERDPWCTQGGGLGYIPPGSMATRVGRVVHRGPSLPPTGGAVLTLTISLPPTGGALLTFTLTPSPTHGQEPA